MDRRRYWFVVIQLSLGLWLLFFTIAPLYPVAGWYFLSYGIPAALAMLVFMAIKRLRHEGNVNVYVVLAIFVAALAVTPKIVEWAKYSEYDRVEKIGTVFHLIKFWNPLAVFSAVAVCFLISAAAIIPPHFTRKRKLDRESALGTLVSVVFLFLFALIWMVRDSWT